MVGSAWRYFETDHAPSKYRRELPGYEILFDVYSRCVEIHHYQFFNFQSPFLVIRFRGLDGITSIFSTPSILIFTRTSIWWRFWKNIQLTNCRLWNIWQNKKYLLCRDDLKMGKKLMEIFRLFFSTVNVMIFPWFSLSLVQSIIFVD